MSVIVTDEGFARDDFAPATADAPLAAGVLISLDRLPAATASDLAVLVENDAEPEALAPWLDRLALIAVRFPSFADGRGFSLARRLRALGYAGRLRAQGHVIVDQYAYARACGFDEIAIDDAQAARQPEAQWLNAARAAPDYREKLRRRAA